MSDRRHVVREGLADALQAGGRTASVAATRRWVAAHEPCTVLLGLVHDDDWAALPDLVAMTDAVTVVALLPHETVPALLRATRLRAHGVVAEHHHPDRIAVVLDAAEEGLLSVPHSHVADLVRPVEETLHLDDYERGLLRGLRSGASVSQLARQRGRDRSTVTRHLQQAARRNGFPCYQALSHALPAQGPGTAS